MANKLVLKIDIGYGVLVYKRLTLEFLSFTSCIESNLFMIRCSIKNKYIGRSVHRIENGSRVNAS